VSTWAAESFGNDDALAWVTDFCNSPEYHLMVDALSIIEESEDQHLSAQYCAIAVAAAEIVAALKKAPDPRMTGEISDCLIKLEMPVDAHLVQLATRAVIRIRSESELKDSWEGSRNADQWYAAMDNLEKRLSQ
jgi:hypothetical protein